MTTQLDLDWLRAQLADFDDRIVFATVSGAHLYGFPSRDSDVDIRGAHQLPTEQVVGLEEVDQTRDFIEERDGVEVDLSSHELRKYLSLLLDRNATVLEHIYSPHIVVGGAEMERLRTLAEGCITRHHFHHYRGFARSGWSSYGETRRLKPLLYCYRACLTGIHLMVTGEIEASLATLAEAYDEAMIADLVEQKRDGHEKMAAAGEHSRFERTRDRLTEALSEAFESSTLREAPSRDSREAVSDFLVEKRLDYLRAR